MRPFGRARLVALVLIVMVGVGLGAALASAGVRGLNEHSGPSPGGGPGGGFVDDRCKQPQHLSKWYCQPATTTTKPPPHVEIPTTTTQPQSTTTSSSPPSSGGPGSGPPSPPAGNSNGNPPGGGGGDNNVALPATPTLTTPIPDPTGPVGPIPGIDNLFGRGGGVPLSMALVIAVAGLATVGLVLRGTFGRGAPLPAPEESDTLKFR